MISKEHHLKYSESGLTVKPIPATQIAAIVG